jgi:ribosomal protein S18 acetylase RimI-like enzyme
MPHEDAFAVKSSNLLDFVDKYRPIWLADELAHRPFLRLNSISDKKPLCLTLHNTNNCPLGFAFLAHDDQIVLSPMSLKTVTALADFLTQQDLTVPGIFAPEKIGHGLSEALLASRRDQFSLAKRVLHWELATPSRQRHADGQLELATGRDKEFMIKMHQEMQHEMNTQRPYDAQQKVTSLMARQQLFVWKNCAGEIVSTGAAEIGASDSRHGEISSIYTPPRFRGQNYASAMISILAEKLLALKPAVFLSSDADAAASSQLYEKLGFEVKTSMINLRRSTP